MSGWRGHLAAAARALLPKSLRSQWRELAEERVLGRPLKFVRNRGAELEVTLEFVLASYQRRNPDIFFLQIGAFDGMSGDPLSPLIERYALRGILVEPQREFFERLKTNYARFNLSNFTFVNAAIGPKDGAVPLYKIRPWPDAPQWIHQHASFDRNHVLKLRGVIPDLESLIEVEQVRSVTFTSLLKEAGRERVDILQIDAEGYDAELLRLFDVPARKPPIVRYEHTHLSERDQESCLSMLIDQGYKVAICGGDTLAYLAQD
jgi:FkbM family methyltransferase